MKVLITGGAGFIGVNAAYHFRSKGSEVVIFDNLSRTGSEFNLDWLRSRGPVTYVFGDLTDSSQISRCLEAHPDTDLILHLAAQVAVTTSVLEPRPDFEINALGTFNLLEAVRRSGRKPVLIYASTNKVYGGMEGVKIAEKDGRYAYAELAEGVPEGWPLDFHSPYGCSKGCADQYVHDYSRIYGLPTIVFRQSCIYGPHQFGVEDQGWVAWLTIAALLDQPITIYGDGRQVRDVLHVDDLVRAFDLAFRTAPRTHGGIYNIGGGPELQLSVLQLVQMLETRLNRPLAPAFADWRPGDQKIYVSDIRKARADFQWRPAVGVEKGIGDLIEWVRQNKQILGRVLEKTSRAAAS